MEKTLYRARHGRWLAGVCAGMAKYMNLTPTAVRLIFVLMSLFFLSGIWVYITSIIMIPMEPKEDDCIDTTGTIE